MDKEAIFNAAAKNGMVEFQLKGFKNSFPSLYKVIMKCMDEAYNEALDLAAEKGEAVIIHSMLYGKAAIVDKQSILNLKIK